MRHPGAGYVRIIALLMSFFWYPESWASLSATASVTAESLGFQSDILAGAKEMAGCQRSDGEYIMVVSELATTVSILHRPVNAGSQWRLVQVLTGRKSLPEVVNAPRTVATSVPYMNAPKSLLLADNCERMLIRNTDTSGENSFLIFLDYVEAATPGDVNDWQPTFILTDQSMSAGYFSDSVPVQKVSYLQGKGSISDLTGHLEYLLITSCNSNSIKLIQMDWGTDKTPPSAAELDTFTLEETQVVSLNFHVVTDVWVYGFSHYSSSIIQFQLQQNSDGAAALQFVRALQSHDAGEQGGMNSERVTGLSMGRPEQGVWLSGVHQLVVLDSARSQLHFLQPMDDGRLRWLQSMPIEGHSRRLITRTNSSFQVLYEGGIVELFRLTDGRWQPVRDRLSEQKQAVFTRTRGIMAVGQELLVAGNSAESGRGLVKSYVKTPESDSITIGGIVAPLVLITILTGAGVAAGVSEYKWNLLTICYHLIRYGAESLVITPLR